MCQSTAQGKLGFLFVMGKTWVTESAFGFSWTVFCLLYTSCSRLTVSKSIRRQLAQGCVLLLLRVVELASSYCTQSSIPCLHLTIQPSVTKSIQHTSKLPRIPLVRRSSSLVPSFSFRGYFGGHLAPVSASVLAPEYDEAYPDILDRQLVDIGEYISSLL